MASDDTKKTTAGDRSRPSSGAEHTTRVRVRYPETDPQGVVHHAVFLDYFELGRTELLRANGVPYSELEKGGARLMITECRLEYRYPAHYDDVLVVRARVKRISKVRIYLTYEITKEEGGHVACTGSTTLASIGEDGRPCAVPEKLTRVLERSVGSPRT